MPDVVTDTHGLIWYLENDQRLGHAAHAAFELWINGNPTESWKAYIDEVAKGR